MQKLDCGTAIQLVLFTETLGRWTHDADILEAREGDLDYMPMLIGAIPSLGQKYSSSCYNTGQFGPKASISSVHHRHVLQNGHRAATLLLQSIEKEQKFMARNSLCMPQSPDSTVFHGLQMSEGKIIRSVTVSGRLLQENISFPEVRKNGYLVDRQAGDQ